MTAEEIIEILQSRAQKAHSVARITEEVLELAEKGVFTVTEERETEMMRSMIINRVVHVALEDILEEIQATPEPAPAE
jgi:hypothetical protein|nr:MAG TPA: hypothetical protein [Caudoviricetes sp.]